MNENQLLSPRQLSKKLNISLKAIVKWTQAGRIPGQMKVGGRWRYNSLSVERALLKPQFLLNKKNIAL